MQDPNQQVDEPVQIDLRRANLQGFNLSNLQLRNAQFTEAALQGADLRGVKLDRVSNLVHAVLKDAAVGDVDFTDIPQIKKHLEEMFGDGSVTLPGGHGPDHSDWPRHWPKSRLDEEKFQKEWRKWQDDPKGDVPPVG